MTQTPTAPTSRGRTGKPKYPRAIGGDSTGPTAEQIDAAVLRPAPDLGAPPPSARRGRMSAYLALTKPRIIELLLVTTVPAMVLAARGLPGPAVVLATLIGGTLAAGSANALNCYVDRDIDAVMHRTGRRPLARQTVTPRSALVFGVALGVIAVTVMAAATNLFAAALTFLAIAFYVIVYTMVLKRRTAQNIVWGGAAGCMPVLIGWVAVTDRLAWPPVVLFLVVFFWTPPHFWALAIRYREDYDRAGVPMLPVVATPVAVARRILAYTWITVAVSLVLWPLATGWVYGVAALGGGAAMIVQAHRLLVATRTGRDPRPMRLFHLSNSYLAMLFVAVAVDTFIR